MKIAIAVPGRFHAFDVAVRLQKHSVLGQLFTSYPKFEVAKYGIDRNLVVSYPMLEAFSRIIKKIPRSVRLGWNPQYFIGKSFADWTARHLTTPHDLLVAFSGCALPAVRKAHEMGMKVVVERHSSHMLFQQKILCAEYAKFDMPFVETHPGVIYHELKEYEEADLINVPSTFVKETFVENGVAVNKLLCLPLGVDLSSFAPRARQDPKFKVIYAGSLSIRKGVIYLLRAFKELNLNDAELWLVGEISPDFRRILKQFESPNVRFIPRQAQSDLSTYYSQCDVFCMPSIEDGFGVVVGQAMACGLPVICTTNAGAKDLIREGVDGFVVSARNVAAIKEKIVWLYQHRNVAHEMGNAALERVRSVYNWDSYTEKLLSAFSLLLNCNTRMASGG